MKNGREAAVKRFTFLVKNNVIRLYGRLNSFKSRQEIIDPELWPIEASNENVDFGLGILTLPSGEKIYSVDCEQTICDVEQSDVVNNPKESNTAKRESMVTRFAAKLKGLYPNEDPILKNKPLCRILEQELQFPPGTIKTRTFERARAKAWPKTTKPPKSAE